MEVLFKTVCSLEIVSSDCLELFKAPLSDLELLCLPRSDLEPSCKAPLYSNFTRVEKKPSSSSTYPASAKYPSSRTASLPESSNCECLLFLFLYPIESSDVRWPLVRWDMLSEMPLGKFPFGLPSSSLRPVELLVRRS